MCRDTSSRVTIAENLETDALERAYAEAWYIAERMAEEWPNLRAPGVLVQRMDQTFEAKRLRWEREFYDIDRAGRRRRRFKRPEIEKLWEEWLKNERARERAKRRQSNAERG